MFFLILLRPNWFLIWSTGNTALLLIWLEKEMEGCVILSSAKWFFKYPKMIWKTLVMDMMIYFIWRVRFCFYDGFCLLWIWGLSGVLSFFLTGIIRKFISLLQARLSSDIFFGSFTGPTVVWSFFLLFYRFNYRMTVFWLFYRSDYRLTVFCREFISLFQVRLSSDRIFTITFQVRLSSDRIWIFSLSGWPWPHRLLKINFALHFPLLLLF